MNEIFRSYTDFMFFRVIFLMNLIGIFCCAQFARAEPLMLSPSLVDSKVGAQTKGILFICEPFCTFISIREEKDWSPPLSKVPVNPDKIKFVTQTDPVYPLLVSKNPILPFTREGLQAKGEGLTGEASNVAPDYAKKPFNYGYALYGGPAIYSTKTTSDTQIQSDMSPKSIGSALWARGALSSGNPQKLFNRWLLHEISGEALVTTGTTADTQMQYTQMILTYQAWAMTENFQYGPYFSINNEAYKFNKTALTHFPVTYSSYLLGGAFMYHRWLTKISYALSTTVQDGADYRQAPIDVNKIFVGVQYCSENLSLFDITFGICGTSGIEKIDERSGLNSDIIVASQSKLSTLRYYLGVSLRIGEDLFR